MTTIISPSPRSKTKRRDAAIHARSALHRYSSLLDRDDANQGSEPRIKALLWAQVHILKALAEETRGRWGSRGATPNSLARTYKEEAER